MKKVFKYFSRYKKECALAPLFKLIEALLELFIPIIVADIIDRGVNGNNSKVIVTGVLLMVLLGAIGLGFSLLGQYFSAKAAVGYSSDLRGALYKKLMGLPLKETDKIGNAKMITAMTSDVGKVQSGVNLALRLLLRSPFVVLGAFVASLIISPKLGVIFGVAIFVLAITVIVIMKITMPKFSTAQKMLDGVSQIARENLSGVRVIRAFGAEETEVETYGKKVEEHEKFQNFTAKISSLLNPLTFVVVNVAIVFLLYFGGVKVELGILTQGAIIALYDYLSQILVELVKFANLVVSISKALASAKRIDEILEIEPKQDGDYIIADKGSFIRFDNVFASYGGSDVLERVNLEIERGQTIGVIGGTGSGKSTLVNLIAGLYKPSAGNIFIDGKNTLAISSDERKNLVAVALQKPALFKGTVKSNLQIGKKDANKEDFERVLTISQARDFVMEKGGVDCAVEQGARNFSGGQKQRLALARAIISKPQILILDDSSSALDYVTDLNLRRALKTQDFKQTVIIVSQRTASVKDADKIIVLDDGEIVGVGSHTWLRENCEVYREIDDSQKAGDV